MTKYFHAGATYGRMVEPQATFKVTKVAKEWNHFDRAYRCTVTLSAPDLFASIMLFPKCSDIAVYQIGDTFDLVPRPKD